MATSEWVSRAPASHTTSHREGDLVVSTKHWVAKKANSWIDLTISRLVCKFKLSSDLAVTETYHRLMTVSLCVESLVSLVQVSTTLNLLLPFGIGGEGGEEEM